MFIQLIKIEMILSISLLYKGVRCNNFNWYQLLFLIQGKVTITIKNTPKQGGSISAEISNDSLSLKEPPSAEKERVSTKTYNKDDCPKTGSQWLQPGTLTGPSVSRDPQTTGQPPKTTVVWIQKQETAI